MTTPLERYAELDKIINIAWAEREGLVLPIIDQFAPFQPDDVIRCGDQILTVTDVWFDGLNTDGQPGFLLEGLIHRRDGSVGQRTQKVFNGHLSEWRKVEGYAGSLNEIAKLKAWQEAAK